MINFLKRNIPFILVGIISVSAAFLLSFKFGTRAKAQPAATPNGAPVTAAVPPSKSEPVTQTPSDAAGPLPAPVPSPSVPVTPGAKSVVEENNNAISSLEGFLEPFIYDAVNRRDPFMAYAEYVPEDATSSPTRPLSPAQRFDLDQLHLVGVMWDVKDPKAMFMDPENEVLVLGRDEGIGNRNGYIASIREGEVVVVEAIRHRGDVVYKTRVLRIER